MRISKTEVLREAATISAYDSEAIVAAVRKTPAHKIKEWEKYVREDGLQARGAIAHEIAVRIALEEGVVW